MMTIRPNTTDDPSGRIDLAGVDAAAMGTRAGATHADPPTGPMPVLDLADGHVHVSVRRDVVIVQIDGGLDDLLAAHLAPAIESAVDGAVAVVLDLDQVTLLDRTGLETVCHALDGIDDVTDRCIVAGRLSGRLVLERWDVPERYAVFTSVPDALQARAFVESGYGNGWALGADT